MIEETALPTGAESAAAGEQAQQTQAAAAPSTETGEQQLSDGTKPEGADAEGDKPEGGKKEKTPEQRERDRLIRRIDNKTLRVARLEAELEQYRQRGGQPADTQRQEQGTEGSSDTVTLSRAEIDRMIEEQATRLAPSINQQQAEIERRQKVVASLSKEWGNEGYNEKAADLVDAVGDLVVKDQRGTPIGISPIAEAIFDTKDPKALIEYLTDPDNSAEARRLSKLSGVSLGREVRDIENKLAEAKKAAKPQPSNAARPLQAVKGGGVPNGMPDPSNTKAWMRWANEQARAEGRQY